MIAPDATAEVAWARYISAIRCAERCTSPVAMQKWLQHALLWREVYFCAVETEAATGRFKNMGVFDALGGFRVWSERHEADHRPVDPGRWRAKRKASY